MDPKSFASELSSFMRALVRVNTVTKMKWYFKRCDRMCLAAIFSAIPSMTSLESFSIECNDLCSSTSDILDSYDTQSYYLWAAYALYTRALTGRPVAAELSLVDGGSNVCERVPQSTTALIDVDTRQQMKNWIPLPLGSSAILHARLIMRALMGAPTPSQGASFVELKDQLVDVIALFNSKVIFVWPGFGLVWAKLSDLSTWQTRGMNNVLISQERYSILSGFACFFGSILETCRFLKLFGAGVRKLVVDSVSSSNQSDFEQLLQLCPRLKNLFISSLKVIEPLLMVIMPSPPAEQLTESAARALLREWLPRDAKFASLAPSRDALEHTRVEVHFLHCDPDDLEATQRHALALRRAMEALNAVASCWGFALDENAAFWRREFAELTAGMAPERLAVVCATTVDGDALVAIEALELREIRLIVAEEDPSVAASELGTLMRALIRVDTVSKMTWCFTRCDRACLETVFSAIPSMNSLESFSVQCDDLVDRISNSDRLALSLDERSYYAWLAFVLATFQFEGRDVAAGVELIHGVNAVFETVLQSPSALIDFVSFQHGRKPVALPYGSSAMLCAGVVLSTDITANETLREPAVSLITDQDLRVDIVALLNSRAIVVFPGCGLVCVDVGHLSDWETRSSCGSATSPRSPLLRSLTCWRSQVEAVAACVESFGDDLQRLYLGRFKPDDKDVLQRILQSCPRLDTLFISSLEAVEPLLSAYESGNCAITTLKIGSVASSELYAVLRTLDDRASRMANILRRLYVEVTTVSQDDVATAAMMLTWNRRLEYLRLCELLPNDVEIGLELLNGFVGQPVVQTSPSRRSAYTFLLAARRHGVLRALPTLCKQAILAFAATPVRRHVSWEQCD